MCVCVCVCVCVQFEHKVQMAHCDNILISSKVVAMLSSTDEMPGY